MARVFKFPKDLTGMRFGRLTVIEVDHRTEQYTYYWRCKCDCGKETVVSRGNLTSGKIISCGCARQHVTDETVRARVKAGTKPRDNLRSHLYHVWARIRSDSRGANPTCQCCDEWSSFEPFSEWSKANGYDPELGRKQHLYLIDKTQPYGPENCQWISREIKDAISNPSKNRPLLTYRGITMNVTAWARTLGISRPTLMYRMDKLGTTDIKKICEAPFSMTAVKGYQRRVICRTKIDVDKILEEKFELTE